MVLNAFKISFVTQFLRPIMTQFLRPIKKVKYFKQNDNEKTEFYDGLRMVLNVSSCFFSQDAVKVFNSEAHEA